MIKWLAMLFAAILSPIAASQSNQVCEAVTLFYEASTEPMKGKRAVLDVIHHRSSALGKSSCQVVRAKGQFSFVHKKFKWKATQAMLDMWEEVRIMPPVVPEAWYFNSGKRKRKYRFIRRIGLHNFYRR